MMDLIRILSSLACVGVLLFCGFGFLATLEPLDRSTQMAWRVIYGMGGFLAAMVLGFLIRRRGPREGPE